MTANMYRASRRNIPITLIDRDSPLAGVNE